MAKREREREQITNDKYGTILLFCIVFDGYIPFDSEMLPLIYFLSTLFRQQQLISLVRKIRKNKQITKRRNLAIWDVQAPARRPGCYNRGGNDGCRPLRICPSCMWRALYWIAKTAVSLCIILYIKSNGDGAVGESYGSFVGRSAAQTKRKEKRKGRKIGSFCSKSFWGGRGGCRERRYNTISWKWWGTKVSYSPMARPTLSRPIYIPKWRPYSIRTGIVFCIHKRESEIYYISHLALPCVCRARYFIGQPDDNNNTSGEMKRHGTPSRTAVSRARRQ